MRVLVANIPLPANRFLVDLNEALGKHLEVVQSSDAFWEMNGKFDIVHFHFPEYLTFDHQDAYREGLTEDLIKETSKRLEHWAKRAKLVVTRHVLLPHDALEDPMWERMYAEFYRYMNGVIHFANASIEEFKTRYGTIDWFRGSEPQHVIIPHHNYASLPNEVSRTEARSRLRIPQDAKVMLVFGAIRNEEEKELIFTTFHGLRLRGKLLLVSRGREQLREISWIRLKYWVRDLTRLYYRIHPAYCFNYAFVEEEDTQLYLNAADILFIPRLWVLNSGNITLGMTYGKVVVGPNAWDVGELLRETGNPVFDPDRPETAVAAVEEGFRLAAEGNLGQFNRDKAFAEWSVERCADAYVDFYRRCVV